MSSTLGRSAKILQSESIQELARGRVQERPADDLLSTADLHQTALQQRADDAGGIDAADLGDLHRGHRLLVGNHRQRFERLHRQLLRRPLVEQAADPLVQLRPRDNLIATGHFDQLQAARAARSGAPAPASAAWTSSFGSVSSNLNSCFCVIGSGDAKTSASTMATRPDVSMVSGVPSSPPFSAGAINASTETSVGLLLVVLFLAHIALMSIVCGSGRTKARPLRFVASSSSFVLRPSSVVPSRPWCSVVLPARLPDPAADAAHLPGADACRHESGRSCRTGTRESASAGSSRAAPGT